MKKLISLAMVAAFSTVVFADDKKPAEACKMECCKKSGKSCKECPDCKKADKKADKHDKH